MKLVIDAGHGGHDTGAIGPTGLHESLVTLELAHLLSELVLPLGVHTILTRTDDTFVPLPLRAGISNTSGADLFLSIHCNAAVAREANGYEVWTTPGQTKSDPIATQIFDALRDAFPHEKGRSDLGDGDPDREANFAVLRLTVCPAVLVETGFISHFETEAQMRTAEWRTQMAKAILAGILPSITPAPEAAT